MKTLNRIIFSFLLVFLLSLTFLYLGCQTEKVADISEETSIVTTINELAGSTTQPEAEAAIRNLITKAEIGPIFLGSRYESYTFSDYDIMQMGEIHLLYLNGEYKLTLGEYFDMLMRVANRVSIPNLKFSTVRDILQKETAIALNDPEKPGNALIAAIAAENGKLPTAVPLYNEQTLRSPVQMVLFSLWLQKEFTGSSVTADGSVKFAPSVNDYAEEWRCNSNCYKNYALDIAYCHRTYRRDKEQRDECLNAAELALEECLTDCHDQGESGP